MRVSGIRRIARKAANAAHYELVARLRRAPVRREQVLYEAFAGSGMLDNPEAIFDRLRRDPAFARYRHVWVIADGRLRRRLAAQWRSEASVRFVPHRGPRYWRALATSGWLVNNATFPPEFAKRPGQRYLNTWHGTPLKQMGYDMPDGARESANTLRNFVQADWLLSQSPEMTERMYEGAYRLGGVFAGQVVEEGYPRTDRQRLDAPGYIAARRLLSERGLDVGERPILLYAPTWKGTRFADAVDDVAELVATVRRLQERVGEDYAVLLKTHQSVFRFARRDPLIRRMLVPNDIPTNLVLGVSEVLVTDYSSIQFDYLSTRRPIVYYLPDLDGYTVSRGLYLPIEDWPGPVARTPDQLADAVRMVTAPLGERDPWAAARQAWSQRFAGDDDGGAAERVVDVVFRGRAERRRVRPLPGDGRPRVLFHLGGMRSNGITTAGLALADALARTGELDVSVVYGWAEAPQRRANAERLAPGIRHFVRQGGMNASRLDHLRRRRGADDAGLWQQEWARCFGDARFDVVVDYSGYAPFWARLMLASPPARRVVWLHNDLVRDAERTVGGRAPLKADLTGMFALYHRFDRLVSVSAELDRINRAALAAYAPAEAFGWVPNLVDAESVRAQAALPAELLLGRDAAAVEPEATEALRRLCAESDAPWFVTVGRLSPEKNHARLIRAFARVHARWPEARLAIVGAGPLRDELEALSARSGAGEAIVFVGPTASPAAFLARAGCFVLSSDYEGMPMVLLEAAVLGLPIVTTRFGSVADAVPGTSVRVAEQDDESLAAAMLAFLRGEVPPARFDAEAHNARAVRRVLATLLPQSSTAVAES